MSRGLDNSFDWSWQVSEKIETLSYWKFHTSPHDNQSRIKDGLYGEQSCIRRRRDRESSVVRKSEWQPKIRSPVDGECNKCGSCVVHMERTRRIQKRVPLEWLKARWMKYVADGCWHACSSQTASCGGGVILYFS